MSEEPRTQKMMMPSANCMVHTDAIRELNDVVAENTRIVHLMRGEVHEIGMAVKGDDAFGHRGLVKRVNEGEVRLDHLEEDSVKAKATMKVIGIIAVSVSSLFTAVVGWLLNSKG